MSPRRNPKKKSGKKSVKPISDCKKGDMGDMGDTGDSIENNPEEEPYDLKHLNPWDLDTVGKRLALLKALRKKHYEDGNEHLCQFVSAEIAEIIEGIKDLKARLDDQIRFRRKHNLITVEDLIAFKNSVSNRNQ